MSSPRIWIIVAVTAIVAVLAGGWFLGAQPMLAAAAVADESSATVESSNQALQVKLAALSKLAASTEKMQADDAVLQKKVPSTLKPNTFIRRVNEVAALHGVRVASVSQEQAAAYTPPPSTEVVVVDPAVDGTTPTDAVPAAEVAPATVLSAPVLAETDPAVTSANLTVVPVTLVVTGTEDAILTFTKSIQNDERVFLVNNLALSDDDSDVETGTLSGYIYTLTR